MTKNLLKSFLWGILALSLLSSCRTEDGAITQKQIEDKRFAVFVPKSGEDINYARGFAFLMQRYDNLHKTNLSGINNNKPIIGNINASASINQNASITQGNEVYVEFGVHTKTFTEENGDKWVVYPKVQGNKVIGLIIGALTKSETYVSYHAINPQIDFYKDNIMLFQNGLDNYLKQRSRLSLSAGIKPIAEGGQKCTNDGSSFDCNIEGVVVTKGPPPPLSLMTEGSSDYGNSSNGGGSGGGGGGSNGGSGTGGQCSDYLQCIPANPDGDVGTWSNDLLLFSKNPSGEKITNIKDYLKCLNLSQGATVTLYVAQPTPNTTSTWSGSVTDPNVGHTFISITQGGITRFMGFYPSQGISPFSSPPAAKGILINDQGHAFNVSITSNINASQLNNLVGYINSVSNATYNLNTFNCTNFGIDAAGKVGISLPKTSGTWPGGGGANPGNLGQDLRSLNNSSIQKNSYGGNAPKNSGNCN